MALIENRVNPLEKDLLPDSRVAVISTPKGATPGPGGFWVPIFCASCGTDGGRVPEENMRFVFWLCNDCFATYGELTNMMVMPDEVFWEQVKQEQLEKYGRLLTNQELISVVEADASPLATLLQQGRSPRGG